jgi:MFS family permease
MPLRSALNDYREAVSAFSPPARSFLVATFLTWFGHGVASVLFNLYLVEAGFRESFVGQAVSLNALGLATMALPAGFMVERLGHRRCLILGAVLEGVGMAARVAVLRPDVLLGASFVAGAGQAMLAIAAAPFLTVHSTSRERTHLFSSFFAIELVAAVAGSFLGGTLPQLARALPGLGALDLQSAYRATLILGAAFGAAAAFPIARLAPDVPDHAARAAARGGAAQARVLAPIALNFFLLGSGAGLVIPFMNLYFATRFDCSSAQIGTFFAAAQVITAVAAMLAPALAQRFGSLNTATVMQFLSLPFLVTLGFERHLETAVAAFVVRATLMQASSPLLHAFVMEALPAELRARSTSLNNLVWNAGWATSATLSGVIIQRFGYDVPFYVTAFLYAVATAFFWLWFRRRVPAAATRKPPDAETLVTEEAKGSRGEGPFTE